MYISWLREVIWNSLILSHGNKFFHVLLPDFNYKSGDLSKNILSDSSSHEGGDTQVQWSLGLTPGYVEISGVKYGVEIHLVSLFTSHLKVFPLDNPLNRLVNKQLNHTVLRSYKLCVSFSAQFNNNITIANQKMYCISKNTVHNFL